MSKTQIKSHKVNIVSNYKSHNVAPDMKGLFRIYGN